MPPPLTLPLQIATMRLEHGARAGNVGAFLARQDPRQHVRLLIVLHLQRQIGRGLGLVGR